LLTTTDVLVDLEIGDDLEVAVDIEIGGNQRERPTPGERERERERERGLNLPVAKRWNRRWPGGFFPVIFFSD
jgi:hypothetical protein